MSGANAVREDRLWQRHADMAKLGGTPKGGVNRQALSAEDAAARNLLAGWARARGFSLSTDAIGNLFVRREGTDANAVASMIGERVYVKWPYLQEAQARRGGCGGGGAAVSGGLWARPAARATPTAPPCAPNPAPLPR